MTNWIEKQRSCQKCKGRGYREGGYVNRRGRLYPKEPTMVFLCECQPTTFIELEEAARQERDATVSSPATQH